MMKKISINIREFIYSNGKTYPIARPATIDLKVTWGKSAFSCHNLIPSSFLIVYDIEKL